MRGSGGGGRDDVPSMLYFRDPHAYARSWKGEVHCEPAKRRKRLPKAHSKKEGDGIYLGIAKVDRGTGKGEQNTRGG